MPEATPTRGSRDTLAWQVARRSSRSSRPRTRRHSGWLWPLWQFAVLVFRRGRMPAATGPRRLDRAQGLNLRNGLGLATQHRYGQSYQALQRWFARRGLPPTSTRGRPFSQAPCTLASVQRYHRRLRGHLRAAWSAVQTWTCTEPGELRAPMPVGLLLGTIALALAYDDCFLFPALAPTQWSRRGKNGRCRGPS